MKSKFLVALLLICVFCLSGCGNESSGSDSSEYDVSFDYDSQSILKKGNIYTVLDVREIEQSSMNYGGSLTFRGERILNLILMDNESNERVYASFNCNDSHDLDSSYLNIAKLIKGDVFKYLGDYDYELIE